MPSAARPERRYAYQNRMTDSRRWDGFKPRAGDIIISTPPKCGTTWMQMICALLIFQKPRLERKLSDLSMWLDMPLKPVEAVFAALESQPHRRFIKTHTPLDGIPYFDNITYLFVARDPRDAFISMGNHRKNMKPEMLAEMLRDAEARNVPLPAPQSDARAAFRAWIGASGVPAPGEPLEHNVLHHADTFWKFRHLPNIHLFHYSDMKADLDGQMRRVAAALGIAINEMIWPELAAAAGFERMKENAETLAPGSIHADQWVDKAAFFNTGEHGQWRGILGDTELVAYRQAMDALREPELAHWLENGSL